jgi:glycosyltransferase involved in cell wall biosynthesis
MSIAAEPKVTVYIIAFNEAHKIAAAVNSVLWADEIIVADSGSTDGMIEIAESLGARVVQVPFKGFGDLRNQAIAACTHDWIFSLDADERCTPEARDEILSVIADPDSLDMYFMPRRNFFMGRWIKHSGWYPNYRQPQLFRRGKMSYTMEPVHEAYVTHSARPIGHLQHPIWQVPFKNLDEVIHKVNRYSRLGAEKLASRGRKGGMGSAFTHGSWAFIKHYVFKLGVLDGWPGFVIAFAYFEQTFYRYAKGFEMDQSWKVPESQPLKREN